MELALSVYRNLAVRCQSYKIQKAMPQALIIGTVVGANYDRYAKI